MPAAIKTQVHTTHQSFISHKIHMPMIKLSYPKQSFQLHENCTLLEMLTRGFHHSLCSSFKVKSLHNPELGDNHVGIQYQDTAKGDKMSPFSIICDLCTRRNRKQFCTSPKTQTAYFYNQGTTCPPDLSATLISAPFHSITLAAHLEAIRG